MGMFLGFLLIILVVVWGTAFTGLYFWRQARSLDRGAESEVTARLLQEVEDLSTRLARVEEEVDFLTELKAPRDSRRLPDPDRSSEEDLD